MSRIVRTEVRKRGFFGKLIKYAFIAFNLLMIVFFIMGIDGLSEGAKDLQSDAEKAGYGLGAALGMGALLLIWALGDIILGLLVILTRGKTTIIEEHVSA